MVKIYFFAFLIFFASLGFAYEVDQFTNRDQVPADAGVDINMIIKDKLEKAVKKANSQFLGLIDVDCNTNNKEARRVLFESLRDTFVSNSDVGLLEREVMKDKNIDKRVIPVDRSIYQEAKSKNPILKGILSTYGIAPVIQVNDVQIGTDKLGHFFNEGYGLYLQNFSQSDEAKRKYNTALFNKSTENDYYGLKTTGVKSYADLAANYEGYQFWNRLCGKVYESSSKEEKDYFNTHKCTKDAYIKCEIDLDTKKGKWALTSKVFKIEDYISPAWDESINCSGFSPAIRNEVTNALSRRVYTYKGDPKKPCPAEPSKCSEIVTRYGNSSMSHVISSECKNIAKEARKEKKASISSPVDIPAAAAKTKASSKKSRTAN